MSNQYNQGTNKTKDSFMQRIIILLLCTIQVVCLCGQQLLVLDSDTNEPLEFVGIIDISNKNYLSTNQDGIADISTFKHSNLLEISLLGYKKRTISYDSIVQKDFTIYLKSFDLKMSEIVVSSTKWRQTTGKIPAKIIRISPEQIELQNPQTAADLLSVSGKVYIQKSQQGGGSPMIRGFATNRLLYSVDGVRMNTAIFRGGNIQNVINIDPFSIENTEVIFGPNSAIYGSDAIGGVMSFQTLTPKFTASNKLLIEGKTSARFSSANKEKTGHFHLNLGGKKWAFVSSISYWNFDHLRQGSQGPDDYLKNVYVDRINDIDSVITQQDDLLQIPSAYTQINTLQKIKYKPSVFLDLQYAYHYSETSKYGRYDRHNRFRNGLPRYGQWDYGPQSWQMHHLNFLFTKTYKLCDAISFNLAQQTFGESRISRTLNKPEQEIQSESVIAYSGNLDINKKISSRHTLFYGAEWILNDVKSTGKIRNIIEDTVQEGPSRYPNSIWQSIGIYLNNDYKLNDKWNIQSSLRYNTFYLNSTFDPTFYNLPFEKATINDGALTGSIGTVYRPIESWVFQLNYATAFRSPNVDDIGKIFDSEPGAVTIPNPNLQAEYAYNVDFGIAKRFDDFLKIDASFYYTILQNAMVRRNYQLNGQDSIFYDGELSQVQAIQNAAVANVYGLQLGVEALFGKHWTLSSDFNFQRGTEELDDGSISSTRHAAPIYGTTRLRYKMKKWHILLYSLYQGTKSFANLPQEEKAKDEIYAKDKDGNNYAPAWYTLNVKGQYHITKALMLQVGIENITDQRYRPFSSGISGAGRNLVISGNVSF